MPVLIVGVSTRAIAESAVRGGHEVITLDYFGDRDQRELVENYSLLRDFQRAFSAGALLEASRHLKFDALAYVANLENYPEKVEKLTRRGSLLGNQPDILLQVRDWRKLRQICREERIPCAITLLTGESQEAEPEFRWLLKPVRSGGGHGIRFWNGRLWDGAHVLQRYIAGRSASVAFAANGKNSVVLGLSEQLIGLAELGARGFNWCGNLLPLRLDPASQSVFLETVEAMATRLTRRFGLRGVNGFDLVLADEADGCPRPFLVEINPRYTASMELMERAYGLNFFSVHLEALAGALPAFSLGQHNSGPYWGKGIVYARQTLTVPETLGGVECGRRDLPFPGDRIRAGHPVCSVFAEADERDSCLNKLLAGARAVRREIGDAVEA
jgi:predicted ATP-grasp superfamily ATP-dependent carboligase